MRIIHRDFTLFADYFQFYLQDDDQDLGNLAEAWTPAAVDRLLAVGPGVVGIGTVRNMDVRVAIEIHDGEPADDVDMWDHVVECALEINTGRIVVAGCTDYFPNATRIDVTPGLYRLRASYGGLDTISEDGLGGSDHYRVQLWGTACSTLERVRKWRRRA